MAARDRTRNGRRWRMAKNGRKRGKMGAVKRGRPRLSGQREPNGRLRRGGSAGAEKDAPAVGATPEQRLRQIALAAMVGRVTDHRGRQLRAGLEMTGAPLDLLLGAGLITAEQHGVLMTWRELHCRIYGAPTVAGRDRAFGFAEVTPQMQARHRAMTESMTAREREAVFAIAIEECWPAWLLARDGWGDAAHVSTADGKRCHLFRAGVAAMMRAEAQPLQALARHRGRRLTEPGCTGNVRKGVSRSGSEAHHDAEDDPTPEIIRTRQAGQ